MRKKFFANTPKAGDPIAKRGLARAFAAMDHAWATLDVLGGHVDWSHGSPTIVVERGDGLPAGGEQYQVLQRDSGGNAVWDWVRAADDPE